MTFSLESWSFFRFSEQGLENSDAVHCFKNVTFNILPVCCLRYFCVLVFLNLAQNLGKEAAFGCAVVSLLFFFSFWLLKMYFYPW